MAENLMEGLRISGLGLLGVFGVLLVFYVITLLLDRIPEKNAEDQS